MEPRTPIPDASEAQAKLATMILDSNELEAAQLAAWMILAKNFSLAAAKKSAKRKFGVPMARTDKWLRQVIPPQFFLDRAQAAKKGSGSPQKAITRQRLVSDVKRHMRDL